MNPIATQQAALDNALVPSKKRLKIERCNARIAFSKPQREETYQVTLEALNTSPCYLAFMITPEICPRILNQDFIAPPSDHEVASLMNIKISHKIPSPRISSPLKEPATSTINESLKNVFLAKSSSQPKSTYEAIESLTEFELKKILLDKIKRNESYKTSPEHKELYEGRVKSYNLDKDLFSSYGKAYSIKRDHEYKDKDKDPSAGSDRGNIAKARQPPRTFDELMSTPIDFSAYVLHNLKIDNLTQEIMLGPAFNLMKGICKSFVELEYHFEECYKVVTDTLDWNNPEGHEYPFDLSKPLSLIEAQGCQVVPADYFFNNDLEYLKGGSSSRK
nr:hypothetical protein [Tanacetum cinerariifolium]